MTEVKEKETKTKEQTVQQLYRQHTADQKQLNQSINKRRSAIDNHVPDISQNTAQGNEIWVKARQGKKCHMYLPLTRVSFYCCEWIRKTRKTFCTSGLHSFLLNSPHKVTHGCFNMYFPLPVVLSSVPLLTFSGWCTSFFYIPLFSACPPTIVLSVSPPLNTLSHTIRAPAKLVIFLAFKL